MMQQPPLEQHILRAEPLLARGLRVAITHMWKGFLAGIDRGSCHIRLKQSSPGYRPGLLELSEALSNLDIHY